MGDVVYLKDFKKINVSRNVIFILSSLGINWTNKSFFNDLKKDLLFLGINPNNYLQDLEEFINQ